MTDQPYGPNSEAVSAHIEQTPEQAMGGVERIVTALLDDIESFAEGKRRDRHVIYFKQFLKEIHHRIATKLLPVAEKEINAAYAAGQAAGPDWQPIDTAPRDGTAILLACENPGGWVMIGWFDHHYNQWCAAYPDTGIEIIVEQTDPPTHWQRLFKPPTPLMKLERPDAGWPDLKQEGRND